MAAAAVQMVTGPLQGKLTYPYAGATFQANDHAKGASGAAAVVTLNADAARPIVLRQLVFGYDATPSAGATITVADGTLGTVFQQAVTVSGPQVITFDPPRCGSINSSLTVTLSGTGTANAYLDVNAYTEK